LRQCECPLHAGGAPLQRCGDVRLDPHSTLRQGLHQHQLHFLFNQTLLGLLPLVALLILRLVQLLRQQM